MFSGQNTGRGSNFVRSLCHKGCFSGKFVPMLGLSRGVKCEREDSLTQRTEHWVCSPQTSVQARTLSPTHRVISRSNRDVNHCPVCLPGLLWESNETMRVKQLWKLQCPTNVSCYDSALLFLESLFHFMYPMYPPPHTLPPQAGQKKRNLWVDEKKRSHRACSSHPVLRQSHGRSKLPARRGAPASSPRLEGQSDRAQHSLLSDFHYAGL